MTRKEIKPVNGPVFDPVYGQHVYMHFFVCMYSIRQNQHNLNYSKLRFVIYRVFLTQIGLDVSINIRECNCDNIEVYYFFIYRLKNYI